MSWFLLVYRYSTSVLGLVFFFLWTRRSLRSSLFPYTTLFRSDFVRRFPDHPRVSEAQIALAEMAYHSTPPKLDEAEKNLTTARATHPTELAVEHADYLAIWLADARGADSDRVIASARDFLRAHPNSPLVAEVRLKLAESHFRRQDFASAQTEFETLAQENPKSALTEQALFLAAQSAMAS